MINGLTKKKKLHIIQYLTISTEIETIARDMLPSALQSQRSREKPFITLISHKWKTFAPNPHFLKPWAAVSPMERFSGGFNASVYILPSAGDSGKVKSFILWLHLLS